MKRMYKGFGNILLLLVMALHGNALIWTKNMCQLGISCSFACVCVFVSNKICLEFIEHIVPICIGTFSFQPFFFFLKEVDIPPVSLKLNSSYINKYQSLVLMI